MTKGTKMLTRHLWRDASAEEKASAREAFEARLATRFEEFYRTAEGAFSYSPENDASG